MGKDERMKKILYIVLDGLGDRPHPKLNNMTPLEAASTPNLDRLANEGQTGLVYTVKKGIAPESDVAVISILGYDAHRYYTGRGPLESFAEGLDIKDGDVAFRVNFATCEDGGGKIVDRRVGRNLTTQEASLLAKEVNEKVKLTDATFNFKNTIGHRGILVIYKGGKLSGDITNTDPAYGKEGVFGVAKEKFENYVLKCEPTFDAKDKKAASAAAETAASLANEFVEKSTRVLEESPINKKRIEKGQLKANVILLRDAGDRLPKMPSLKELYNVKFGSFVEMPVEKGIALLTGMDIIEIPALTSDAEKDYFVRAELVSKRMKDYDGLYVHLKGPDEPAHDGDYIKKKASIEDIDKFFFGPLLKMIDLDSCVICVTADHSTPCVLKAHSADPVPILIHSSSVKSDGSSGFSEKIAEHGAIGVIEGQSIMKLLIEKTK